MVREGYAFSALLGAAMSRVLDDAKEARDMVSSEQMVDKGGFRSAAIFHQERVSRSARRLC